MIKHALTRLMMAAARPNTMLVVGGILISVLFIGSLVFGAGMFGGHFMADVPPLGGGIGGG